ncbi:hypothetical protein [Streptomyces sp. NPDC006134]|uniref:hypothetical protein n=1 Tax=Streptomyces sp. NPDC006134 TaxID=3154467 RepID=UPI0033E1F16D
MRRTPAQRARRRALATAADGGIQRVSVVLYACAPAGAAERILTDLRRYASARDWTSAGEFVDHVRISEPIEQRPGWAALAALIETGKAQGIVTPTHRMCGLRDAEQVRLDSWLAAHRAFVVNVGHPGRRLTAGA